MMSRLAQVPSHSHARDKADSGCGQCTQGEGLGFSFDYAFQPIIDVRTGAPFAFEALVRGVDGAPAESVLSRVTDANRYRFDQACRVKAVKAAKALDLERTGARVSINFLPNAVYRPESCIRTTLEAARSAGFPTSRIIFEVTEVEKIADRAHLQNIIAEYKKFGFLTAIDDFGAGYAGLNLLAEYQPDLLKLDMGLVRDVDRSKPKRAILTAVCGVARSLGIEVIAEGIETAGERDCLLDAGVHLQQGFLFARPAFRALPEVDTTVLRVDH